MLFHSKLKDVIELLTCSKMFRALGKVDEDVLSFQVVPYLLRISGTQSKLGGSWRLNRRSLS